MSYTDDGSSPFGPRTDDDPLTSDPGTDLIDDRPATEGLIPLLLQALQNERFAPDILPYPAGPLDLAFAELEEKTQLAYRAASNDMVSNSLLPFSAADIYRMEVQRVQFIVSDLIRIRLRKIQQFCFAIVHKPIDYVETLSANEMKLAQRMAEITHSSMLASGLGRIPLELQLMTPNPPHAEGDEILPRPDLGRYVVVLFLENVDGIDLGGGISQDAKKNDLLLSTYVVLKPFILAGRARMV